MERPTPIPLRPDPAAITHRARRSLSRALAASARGVFRTDKDARPILARDWPQDDGAALVLKGAVAPTGTAETALLTEIVSAAVLGATGAGATLLQRGLVLSFGRAASISLPTLICDAQHGAFVGEGQPVPVYSGSVGTPVTLVPHKLMAIWTMTRELIEGSAAEALITEAARRSLGLVLDAHLFDTAAGDAVRPSGLREGVAAEPASTATDVTEAMLEDIGKLLTAVSPVGGDVVLIANPVRAQMMPAMTPGTLPTVLGSPAVGAADLIAVSTDGLAAALGPEIEVEASKGVDLHMSDAPLAISSVGTPAVVAVPTRSMFQTDCVGLRLRLGVSWVKRHPATVAWLTTTW